MKRWIVIALLFVLPVFDVRAQEEDSDPKLSTTNSVAKVLFHGKELFEVPDISSVSAEKRVEVILRRLKRAAKSPLISTEDFSIHHDDDLEVSLIMLDADVMCAIWESDAAYHGVPRQKLAEHWQGLVKESIDQYRKDYTGENYVKGAVFSAIAGMLRNRSKAFENRALPGPLDVPQIPDLIERGKLQLAHVLPKLNNELADRPWLAGDKFSFADIDLLVAVDFMAWVKQTVPEDCTHLRAWYDRAKSELGQ